MGTFHRHSRGGKRLQKKSKSKHHSGVRLAALLLCLSMLTGFLPALARAADNEEKLSSIVTFDSITLHYAGADGQSVGEKVPNNALLKKDDELILRYTYAISEEQCKQITAGTNYYLEISLHLVLPDLNSGKPLIMDGETEPFGMIYADGSRAWVTFLANEAEDGTVLSDLGGIEDAYFYLDCNRAGTVPDSEPPLEGHSNLYAMKFENGKQLTFGYAENEPVTAKAQINKGGSLTGKTITWTINYTPWQNPTEGDGVTLDTPFELRDTIDTSLHSYVNNSVSKSHYPPRCPRARLATAGSKACVDRSVSSYFTSSERSILAVRLLPLSRGFRIWNTVYSVVSGRGLSLLTYQAENWGKVLSPKWNFPKYFSGSASLDQWSR